MSQSQSRARVASLRTPSGIEIWHVEDYTVPVLSLECAFPGGAAQDPQGKIGLANLMTGLFDEGAGALNSEAFQDRLEEKAIELSFSASRDRIDVSLRTLAQHAGAAFELMGLAVREPRFEQDAIERVRAQIISGLKRDETDPSAMTREALNRIGFEGHVYSQPTDGRIADLQGITHDDLAKAHRRLLGRDGLKVVAVGAISADALIAGVEAVFGGLPAKADITAIDTAFLKGQGRVEVLDLDVPQSTLYLALPAMARKAPDFIAAHIVNHILGGGSFTSRLWTEVREKRGLAYSVWSTLAPRRHASIFMAGTATSNERMGESLAILKEEIARMAETGPTAEEFEKAKRFLIGSYALRFDTSRKIAGQLLEMCVEGLGMDYMDRRNGEIESVTLESAKAVSAKLFSGVDPLVIVTGRPVGIA